VLLYFSIKQKYRWLLLLIGSYYFYMSWKPEYVILIMVTTLIDWFAARNIQDHPAKKKLFLSLSLIANLGLLMTFKYWNFFNDSLRSALSTWSIPFTPATIKVLLPVGISFYTFQSIAYVVDVYRGKIKPERHLGIYASFISFFPQLVAGPIERAKNLLPQFYEKHKVDYQRIVDGCLLIMWGFFKKIVIADRLSTLVTQVYADPTGFSGPTLALATVFFAIQIYCDFSGYSDIAIGSAQILGFTLMDNFKRPYYARSVPDFWRRWHISLSTWFRDYFYIPLGGNRVKVPRWYLNLFITFLVSGLWHGAQWTFVIWGALHGILIVIHHITDPLRQWTYKAVHLVNFPRLIIGIEILSTLLVICITWVFFRANKLSDAWYVITHLFSGWSFSLSQFDFGVTRYPLIVVCCAILLMEVVHLVQEHAGMRHFLSTKPRLVRWSLSLLLLLAILLFGKYEYNTFIYFQF
jgi:D-alanyl-lipoteichoic acid acyltransferase DltB (MBOAT superfamily)